MTANADEIRRTIVRCLEDIAPDADASRVDPQRDLRDALDLDSMDFLRFVQALKTALGVEVPERDYPELRTLAGGTAYLAAFGTATFGEATVVPESACVPIDRDFPLDLAALVGCGVVTGVGAVCNSAQVAPGESVAVVGCGGVGLAAIQGARLAGAAPIIAVDRVAAKLDLARNRKAGVGTPVAPLPRVWRR